MLCVVCLMTFLCYDTVSHIHHCLTTTDPSITHRLLNNEQVLAGSQGLSAIVLLSSLMRAQELKYFLFHFTMQSSFLNHLCLCVLPFIDNYMKVVDQLWFSSPIMCQRQGGDRRLIE